jgi:hypothetical protein
MLTRAALLTAAVLLVGVAWAAEFEDYPQFRYFGGLPGNGFAVNADGEVGWDGAMSQCIPLGYTPSHGSCAVSYASGSINGGFALAFEGSDVNGTLATTVGVGPRGHGVSATAMFVEEAFSVVALNLQAQVLKETSSQPAVSIGMLDVFNRREARLHAIADRGGRSAFIAATKRFEVDERPLHVTVGFGNHRFNERPFVGASYDACRRVKVLAEYDGFGVNAAAAAQVLPQRKGSDQPDALTVFVGVADLERPVLGVSYSRKGLF